jgi:N-acetylglucosamine-6-phosphate deacetylase
MESLLLQNARIVAAKRVVESASMLIANDRISGIFGDNDAPKEVSTVHDLEGLSLYPAFIDVHIHGAVGVDVMNASAEDLHRLSRFLCSQGVSAWLPTLVPAARENYSSAVSSIERAMQAQKGAEARILGVHYEGPFVNSAQCGALHTEHFKAFSSPDDLSDLPVPDLPGVVKMMTLAPEVDGGIELVRQLNERGWIVSIGHTRAGIDVLDRACEAGAHHMTHFMNAMAPLHHRSPGPIGWGLKRDDVTCDIIADGIHLDPFMLRLLLQLKRPERLSLISDAIAATGMGDGDYQIWGETISVVDGRTQNARGSIAGSVITMLDAVRMMLDLGVSEIDIARMTSANPARLLRIDHECGAIDEGKRADLVALDRGCNVRLTVIGGSVVSFA